MEPMQTQPIESKGYFEKNKKMIIVLLALLLIFCGLVTFLFLSSRPGENKAVTGSVIKETDTTDITPVVSEPVVTNPTPTSSSPFPASWKIVADTTCNVDIAVPANEAPYVDNSNGQTKTWKTAYYTEGLTFKKGVGVYLGPDDGTGTDASAPVVDVRCLENSSSDEGPGILALFNTDAQSLGGSVVLQNTISKWGIDKVYVVTLTAGQTNNETGYVFVKGTTSYYITVKKYLYESTFNDYAQLIFDNLKFN